MYIRFSVAVSSGNASAASIIRPHCTLDQTERPSPPNDANSLLCSSMLVLSSTNSSSMRRGVVVLLLLVLCSNTSSSMRCRAIVYTSGTSSCGNSSHCRMHRDHSPCILVGSDCIHLHERHSPFVIRSLGNCVGFRAPHSMHCGGVAAASSAGPSDFRPHRLLVLRDRGLAELEAALSGLT